MTSPLHSLVRKLHQHHIQESSDKTRYSIAIRAQNTVETRANTVTPVDQPHVYQSAGLLTPPEQSYRDLGAIQWFHKLWDLFNKESRKGNLVEPLYVQTLPKRSVVANNVLNLSKNPFGWSENEMNEMTLNDLDKIREHCRGHTVIFLDSLSALMNSHGKKNVDQFARSLECKVLVVKSSQIQADAYLVCQQGQVILLRRGVREHGQWVREMLLDSKVDKPKEEDSAPIVQEEPKKPVLDYDEEARAAPAAKPKIFLQDNDPEFEDYDEEDPDDDLEI